MKQRHGEKSIPLSEFQAAESWSVEHLGMAVDDARQIDDVGITVTRRPARYDVLRGPDRVVPSERTNALEIVLEIVS